MCGIIGYSGKKSVDTSDFKILLLYSQLRGEQSTGFGTFDTVVKSTDTASYFIAKNPIPLVKNIIGHTRRPSSTTSRTENEAQPFDLENIVGAHNGYIRMDYTKERKYNDIKIDSDSYPILNMLSTEGVEATIKSLYSTATLSLIWLDKKNKTLNLYRKDKPAFIGHKDGGIWVASEKNYLEAIDCERIQETKEEIHYKFKEGKCISKKEYKIAIRHNNVKHTNHRKERVENKTHKMVANVPKVEAIHAPKDAKCLFLNGIKRYYWLDVSHVLHVESIITHDESELEKFNLGSEAESVLAARKYIKIVQKINEDLDS